MRHHLADVQHIGVFMVQIEQVDLVRQRAAVEAAFLDQHHVKAVRVGVDRRRAHAARGALAADDQAVDAELAQVRDQRRAEEAGGALLIDDDFARLRCQFGFDVIDVVALALDVAVGRMHAAGV